MSSAQGGSDDVCTPGSSARAAESTELFQDLLQRLRECHGNAVQGQGARYCVSVSPHLTSSHLILPVTLSTNTSHDQRKGRLINSTIFCVSP